MTLTRHLHPAGGGKRVSFAVVRRLVVLLALAVSALVVAPMPSGLIGAPVVHAACGRGGLDEAQLDAMFAGPGLGATGAVQGFGGGDYPHAYPLPDGRILWLFQDLHFSNDENLRNDVASDIRNGTATNAAHNAGLLQQGDCFRVLGDRGRDFIGDALTQDSRRWFWPLDGEIGPDGNLWLFMVEMRNPSGLGAGPGAIPTATWLAIVDPDTLAQLYFRPAPDSSAALYGYSVVSTDQWSYLYGNCYRQYTDGSPTGRFDECTGSTMLARVPRGRFDLAPEYWSGTGWSASAAAAVPVRMDYQSHAMSIQWFGDSFVSVSKENEWWGPELVVERAAAPQGPWVVVERRDMTRDMKCDRCGNYGAFLMPWLDSAGRMVVALSSGGDFELWRSNAWIYRPTFHTFDLPQADAQLPAATPPAFAAGAGSAGFQAVDPERLVDTRRGDAAFGTLAPGRTAVLDLAGRMPVGAKAVALNLTTDRSDRAGWVRAFPCASPEPATSNVNPAAGRIVTNAAIVPVGDGRICFTSFASTDLIVDLNGWLTTAASAGLVPANRRLADTRTGQGGVGRLVGGDTIEVAVTSPGSATTAVALGVTAADPSAAGYVTAWPCGSDRPEVSNLNPEAGVTRPNLVNVRVSSRGTVCLYSLQGTDLVVDLLGEYRSGAGARYAAVGPQRLLDTRTDGHWWHHGMLTDVVPLGAVVAAQVNITVTDTLAAGYATAWSCLDRPWPGTSNVNHGVLDTSAGAAIMVASRGYGCVLDSARANLVVDIVGVWR